MFALQTFVFKIKFKFKSLYSKNYFDLTYKNKRILNNRFDFIKNLPLKNQTIKIELLNN